MPADKKPQSALVVSHQPLFEQLAMMNLQIVPDQKRLAPRIFYQSTQKFDHQTCVYCLPVYRKSRLPRLVSLEIESRFSLQTQIRGTGSVLGNTNNSKKGV
jgi:hypothetical protein